MLFSMFCSNWYLDENTVGVAAVMVIFASHEKSRVQFIEVWNNVRKFSPAHILESQWGNYEIIIDINC